MPGPEFGVAREIAHQYSESAVRRNGEEHPQDTRTGPVLVYVADIFDGGEAHPHHHGVHDTIEGVIKMFAGIKDGAQHQEFTAFLAGRHDAEGEERGRDREYIRPPLLPAARRQMGIAHAADEQGRVE